MSPLVEAILGWTTLVLAALGLLCMMIWPLTPDRWVFEAGYACVPDGRNLILSPRRMRVGHFVWWSFGFGLSALGLACMTGVPLLAGSVTGDELQAWYEWLGLGVFGVFIVGVGALLIWIGRKLMRSRWFAGPLRETRFCWRDDERWIDISTTRLLRKPVLNTYACRDLAHLLVGGRRSIDGAVVGGSLVRIQNDLAQLVLVFRNHRPIDLMGRINDGEQARRTAGMIGAWCGVDIQRVDGLPDVTPFNFDRI
ncbi:hypothetical protein P350_26485 [Burkholderia cepacia JBK9]|nr:hypothetical protein [Burkholderia arboris]ALX15044.1 hypothetical protein P350_26485 [Burkholderia cepacia JBK9]UTV59407.1 hypothetical protein NLX30_25135 [Burkholderia arboris]